jgi:hypothetical protein
MTRDEKIETLRKAIIEQANAMGDLGWMTIDIPISLRNDGKLRVPRAPFELWAVALSGGSHLVSPWKNVSPVGVKQGADDPNHTDWMLGAGLEPLDMKIGGPNPSAEELSAAAYTARATVERRVLAFECSVLLQGHAVTGRVHTPSTRDDFPAPNEDGMPPVTIVKNAGPDWLEMAIKTFQLGGAIIVERGGEMAHLVTELRATGGGSIIRKEKARTIYPPGSLLKVEPVIGRLTLIEDPELVSERAATAFNATPLEDGPVLSVTPPPPHKPGFGIVPHNPNKRHPSYNTTIYDPCFKLPSANWDLYAAWEYNKGGYYDPHYGYEMYLSIWAFPVPRLPGDRTRPMFHSDKRIWKDGELSQAVHDVLYMIDPEAKFAGQRLSEELARQRATEKAKIAELSDDRIIYEMRRLGREEDGLWEEKESGDLTQQDYTYMLSQYSQLFRIYGEIVSERGIELDMAEIRPFIASQQTRDDETLARMDARQQELDDFMRNTPPEIIQKGPRI